MRICRSNPEKLLLKKHLNDMEAKRLTFALDSLARQYHPKRALYVQREDGFTGIGVNNKTLYLITGPAPGSSEYFQIQPLQDTAASLKPIFQEIKGMGGLFGYGEKGGAGWRLVIEGSKVIEIDIIPCLTYFSDVIRDDDRLFSIQENNKNNIYRYMRPQSHSTCYTILTKWLSILQEIR